MATATLQHHTVRFDAVETELGWEILDADGDVIDSFATRAEATSAAKAYDAEAQAERDDEEAQALRDGISEALESMSLTRLRKLAESLGV